MNNLFHGLPQELHEELVDIVAQSDGIRIERIVSTGQNSPDGFWYDQVETEWVILLRGAARLLFEGDSEPVLMKPGDHVTIPPHRRHRVQWTTADEPTVWLAVFYRNGNPRR